MGDKPEKVYRYRNLKLVIWKNKDDGKPTITIGRGYRPVGAKKFVNLSLNLYVNNVPQLLCLFKDYLKDYPVDGFKLIISEKCDNE